MKIRYDTLKAEHESEILQMENIILELQRELFVRFSSILPSFERPSSLFSRRAARDEIELKRKKYPSSGSLTPPKSQLNQGKSDSPTTPTNEFFRKTDRSADESRNSVDIDLPSQSSRRSSHSTTTTNTDDDQYELARKFPSLTTNPSTHPNTIDVKSTSSLEIVSSAASLSSASSSSEEEGEDPQQPHPSTMMNDAIALE